VLNRSVGAVGLFAIGCLYFSWKENLERRPVPLKLRGGGADKRKPAAECR
jgi:hypothetical protein